MCYRLLIAVGWFVDTIQKRGEFCSKQRPAKYGIILADQFESPQPIDDLVQQGEPIMSQIKPKLIKTPICSKAGVHYRLYRILVDGQQSYRIIAQYLQDRAECVFRASSDDLAREIYWKIVNGRVTPCTLNDVVEDLTS